MADIKITLDDLDDRSAFALKQRAHLRTPTEPLITTRSLQREAGSTLNPLEADIMSTGQVLMGATTQITAEQFTKAYRNVISNGVLRIWTEPDPGEYPSEGDLFDSIGGAGSIPPPDSGSAAAVLAIAQAEIGYVEQPGNVNKYAEIAGHSNGAAWCATFIDAVFTMAGVKDDVIIDASTENCRTRAIEKKRWGTTPQVGAVVFFNYKAGRNVSHVELVLRVEGAKLITIGGNTSSGNSGSQDNGDGVFQRTRTTSSAVGYYYPIYPSQDDLLESARIPQGAS